MWLRNATGFPRGTDEGTQSRGKGVVNSAWGWGEGFWGKAVSFLDFVKATLIARSKNPFQRSWDKKGNYYKANRVAHETLWQERQWGLEGAGTHASPSKEGRPEWPGWVRYLPGPLGDGQGVPLSWCHLANMVSEALPLQAGLRKVIMWAGQAAHNSSLTFGRRKILRDSLMAGMKLGASCLSLSCSPALCPAHQGINFGCWEGHSTIGSPKAELPRKRLPAGYWHCGSSTSAWKSQASILLLSE